LWEKHGMNINNHTIVGKVIVCQDNVLTLPNPSDLRWHPSGAAPRLNPKARPTLEDIEKYGDRRSPDILLIVEGGKENLSIEAKHLRGNKMYKIDAKGELSSDCRPPFSDRFR